MRSSEASKEIANILLDLLQINETKSNQSAGEAKFNWKVQPVAGKRFHLSFRRKTICNYELRQYPIISEREKFNSPLNYP